MSTSCVHPEILPDVQQSVLSQLGAIVDADGFYLGGGTAVALHLGHRRSIDLDWFVADDFGDPLRYASRLATEGIKLDIKETAQGTLHGTVDGVKVSFLTYSYPLVESLVDITGFGCQMASLDDLACMKLAAVAQRGSTKDFVDVYGLLANGWTLPQMLALYQTKYGVQDIGHLVMSLTYFDDADMEPMPLMLNDWDWQSIRSEIQGRVRKFVG